MITLASRLMLACALAYSTYAISAPAQNDPSPTGRCFSHLNEMISGDTLDLNNSLCYLNNQFELDKLAAFLTQHPQIKSVKFFNFAKASIKPLIDIPTLTSVISFPTAASDAQLMAGTNKYESLTLYGELTDADMKAIAESTSIHSLIAINTSPISATDAGFLALSNNKNLHEITINARNQATDVGLLALLKNDQLITLGLDQDTVSDDVANAIANHPSLQTLSLGDTISSEELKAIIGNQHLRNFTIHYRSLDDETAALLAKNENLNAINANARRINDKGIYALAKLPALSTLELIVVGDKISDEALASLIANPSLHSLILHNFGSHEVQMGPKTLLSLATNTSLNNIDLNWFKNGDAIATAIARNPAIRTVSIRGSFVTSAGAKALTKATLNQLIIEQNQTKIDDEGGIALASNSHLLSLTLTNNNLTSESAKAFAKNTTLQLLDLPGNRVDDEGAKALAANTTLKVINLYGNRLSQNGVKTLEANTTFVNLITSVNAQSR